MMWTQHPPVFRILTHLAHLRLRAERLALARKIRTVEGQALAAGLPTTELVRVRQALGRHRFDVAEEPTFEIKPVPRPGTGGPLRHLSVTRLPGNKF